MQDLTPVLRAIRCYTASAGEHREFLFYKLGNPAWAGAGTMRASGVVWVRGSGKPCRLRSGLGNRVNDGSQAGGGRQVLMPDAAAEASRSSKSVTADAVDRHANKAQAAVTQLSNCRPGTLANSRVLLVTNKACWLNACAAIMVSSEPMGVP